MPYLCRAKMKRRFRLAARTHASHAWNTGSIPVGATKRHLKECLFFFICIVSFVCGDIFHSPSQILLKYFCRLFALEDIFCLNVCV